MQDSEEAFFAFMAKREQLRLRKESGAPWPWSEDPILNAFKFTNVKREDDRTTKWMRQNWTMPHGNRPHGEIIFNCAFFRYFGTMEFAAAAGWRDHWDSEEICRLAAERQNAGERVFTGAYIIPSLGHRGPKAEAVSRLILTPLWQRRDELADVADQSKSWEQVANVLRGMPGFGGSGFMAKEVLQDAMHTPAMSHVLDRNTWCPAGPGARRGLNRLYGRPIGAQVKERALIAEMITLLAMAEENLPDYMPELELHDIQFQLCEFDKYERTRLGEGRPKSRYLYRGS
ncbi:nucleotide kinase domain-containing protein [Novosphingobium kaempferiae]|uniref:nucleotide kinase domain-containing protein n=1 Tax=Novosphingobium kaempferiae TaxID=2896849 RepID=UPI001E4A3D3E|nr:nucleotide kinase domain-containing protein [Novosphingobium kaempferiae]